MKEHDRGMELIMSKASWIFVFVLAGALSLFLGIKAINNLWIYYSFDTPITVKVLSWEIEEASGSSFIPVALVEYAVEGNVYHCKGKLSSSASLNVYAAQSWIAKRKEDRLAAWINPKNPTAIRLERELALKDFFYFILSISITLYFIYIERIQKMNAMTK